MLMKSSISRVPEELKKHEAAQQKSVKGGRRRRRWRIVGRLGERVGGSSVSCGSSLGRIYKDWCGVEFEIRTRRRTVCLWASCFSKPQ